MTLQDLGNLGEFVAAIGVVASFLYLALQVRHNTAQLNLNAESLHASNDLAATRMLADFAMRFADSTGLPGILDRGMSSPEELSIEERGRFAALFGAYAHIVDGLFTIHRRGSLSPSTWEPLEASMVGLLREHLPRRCWESHNDAVSADFRNHIAHALHHPPSELWRFVPTSQL
jgi:hypothetical protein